jgi:hypothetical protein
LGKKGKKRRILLESSGAFDVQPVEDTGETNGTSNSSTNNKKLLGIDFTFTTHLQRHKKK